MDVDSEEIKVYVKYFDVTFIPSTIFFFNAHHMKIDSGYAMLSLCTMRCLYCFVFLFGETEKNDFNSSFGICCFF